jgi:hypothetical protein
MPGCQVFSIIPDDLKYVEENGTFEDVQEEKRRLRLSHVFRNNNEDEVTSLTAKISCSRWYV